MKPILFEIKELFNKERIYSFLLILILVFFTAVLFAHKTIHEAPVPSEGAKKIETLLHDAPDQPAALRERLSQRPGLALFVALFTLAFMAAFCLGIWFGSRDLWKWFERRGTARRVPMFSCQRAEVSWGISEVIKVAILVFSSGILLNLVLASLQLFFRFGLDSSFLLMLHTLILDVAVVFFVVYFMRLTGARLEHFVSGLGAGSSPGIASVLREIWLGIRTYFVILPIFAGILMLLVAVASLLAYEPPPHPLVEVLLKEERLSLWVVVSSLFAACVVGPVVEEIFFRGFFYPALRKYFGVGWAMVVTAALFAFVHENLFAFLPIFFLGLALCYLYESRRNLVSCISMHILHNSAFIAYFFLVRSILLGNA